MKKIINNLGILLIIVSALQFNSYATTQKLLINEERLLNIVVSKTRINRITMRDDSIRKVIGNSNEFTQETDNGNVYIVPNGEPGSFFEVTLDLESGKTQSLRCKVTQTDIGQIILLSTNNKTYNSDRQNSALRAIQEMGLSNDQPFHEFQEARLAGLGQITASQRVDLGDIQGFKILVKNNTRKDINLVEQDLSLPGYKILAVSIMSDKLLQPKAEALILAAAIKR